MVGPEALCLTSGLALGWALGGNDAANVFGTAVGSRMVRFRTAALLCSLFILLGAVVGGEGPARTLERLGAVGEFSGAFAVALAAALSVWGMSRWGLPVSVTQAIVGGIVGWNLHTGAVTDHGLLTTIVATWFLCPLLAALIAMVLYKVAEVWHERTRLHLLRIDRRTRWALVAAGVFGAYSLGANNIANVMGVFLPVSPFDELEVGNFSLSSAQLLFGLGGVAIGVGVFTHSRRVMLTVGRDLLTLSPIGALVTVLAHSLVLFLFASQGLEGWLMAGNLPTIPLVPVSSSQAIIGAALGVGLLKGGRGIRYRVLGKVAAGWTATPVIALVLSLGLLVVMG